jgi:hypothetical protein
MPAGGTSDHNNWYTHEHQQANHTAAICVVLRIARAQPLRRGSLELSSAADTRNYSATALALGADCAFDRARTAAATTDVLAGSGSAAWRFVAGRHRRVAGLGSLCGVDPRAFRSRLRDGLHASVQQGAFRWRRLRAA